MSWAAPGASALAAPRPTPRLVKSDNAMLVGILNKLNASNYDRMVRRALDALQGRDEAAWQGFLGMAIDKCYTQSFYVDTFVRLVADLIRTADQVVVVREGEEAVPEEDTVSGRLVKNLIDFITSFLDRLRSEEPVWSAPTRPSSAAKTDYDVLCERVKERARLLGINKAVLKFVSRTETHHGDGRCWPLAPTDTARLMEGYVQALEEGFRTANAQGDEQACELCVEFLVQVVEVRGRRAQEVRRCFEVAVHCPVLLGNTRCKLRFMDVADGLGLGLDGKQQRLEEKTTKRVPQQQQLRRAAGGGPTGPGPTGPGGAAAAGGAFAAGDAGPSWRKAGPPREREREEIEGEREGREGREGRPHRARGWRH